jgi:hypothetical protein
MLQTYEGVVQRGQIQLPANANLAEGTRVYVTIVPTLLDERQAKREAAFWLANNVGNLCQPGSAILAQHEQRRVWRFSVMLGSPYRSPRGPIGQIDIDAETGEVLAPAALSDELTRHAETLESEALPARS